MKFGIRLPQFGRFATGRTVRSSAQLAERLRYHSVWVGDHVVLPLNIRSRYPYNASGKFAIRPSEGFFEPITTLSFAAGATQTIRLGISVLVAPMRNPVVSAKELAMLDFLSGGRLILGLGVGWMKEEFEAIGMSFDNRGKIMDEMIEIYTLLWTKSRCTYTGKKFSFSKIVLAPKPLQQPTPPITIGGHSTLALKRAAIYGDGWHAIDLNPKQMGERLKVLRSLLKENGRNEAEFEISLGLPFCLKAVEGATRNGAVVQLLPGQSPKRTIGLLNEYKDLGVELMVFHAGPQLRMLNRLTENFARYVMPEFS